MHLFIRIALSVALISAFCAAPAMARNKNFASATDLQLSTQEIDSASVGRDLLLHAVQVEGKLAAGRNVTCTECQILGGVSAGHDVLLEGCPEVRHVSTGHNAEVTRSRVAANISAGNDVILNDTTVEQRISAGNQVMAEKSNVKGLLSLGGHYARLDGSQAADILFSQGTYTSSSSTSSSSGIQITGGNYANVNVGPSSLSSINGYTVKGAMNQTTVITPEQSIYVNGGKVSGDGPKTYGEYRAAHPEAPSVHGPGWTSDSPVSAKPVAKGKVDKTPKTVINVLELANGSTVTGQVQFDSGYGKILVRKGSEFKGNVVNGFVEKAVN